MGWPRPSLLLRMTQGEKQGLPALHCSAPAAGPRHELCQQEIYTRLNARTKLGTTDTEQGLAETFTAHHKPPAFINSARFPLWKTADQGPNQPPSPGQILLSPSHTGGQGTGQDTDLAPTFIRKTFFPLRMALSSKENSFSRMTDRLSLSPV